MSNIILLLNHHNIAGKLITFNMKSIYKIGSICFPFLMLISICLLSMPKFEISVSYLEENDYRLKFVDSGDVDLGLSPIIKIIHPIDVLTINENNQGWIELETYENSVVLAPIDSKLIRVSSSSQTAALEYDKILIELKNIICGVKVGKALMAGEVLGTVQGTKLLVKIYYSNRLLSKDEVMGVL